MPLVGQIIMTAAVIGFAAALTSGIEPYLAQTKFQVLMAMLWLVAGGIIASGWLR